MNTTPSFPINPKVNGQGTVTKKDGTVSTPPKEKEHGGNANDRSA